MKDRKFMIAVVSAAVLAIVIAGMVFVLTGRNNGSAKSEGIDVDNKAFDDESGSSDGITVTRSPELIEAENKELLEVYKVMKEDNPDFAGYLRVPGTMLEYPVMYTPYDPEKYLHMDINGNPSDDGLPFIDRRCEVTPDSDNIIIYGHNMKDGSMFASLMSYQNKKYYKEHPIIRYDTVDEIREYEVMSVFYDRVYYTDETDVFKFYDFINAENKADFDYNIGQYLKKSVYDTGVKAEYGDKLITLVTCAYHTENGRFVVVARRK